MLSTSHLDDEYRSLKTITQVADGKLPTRENVAATILRHVVTLARNGARPDFTTMIMDQMYKRLEADTALAGQVLTGQGVPVADLRDGDQVHVTRTTVEDFEGTVVTYKRNVMLDMDEPGPWGSTARQTLRLTDVVTRLS